MRSFADRQSSHHHQNVRFATYVQLLSHHLPSTHADQLSQLLLTRQHVTVSTALARLLISTPPPLHHRAFRCTRITSHVPQLPLSPPSVTSASSGVHQSFVQSLVMPTRSSSHVDHQLSRLAPTTRSTIHSPLPTRLKAASVQRTRFTTTVSASMSVSARFARMRLVRAERSVSSGHQLTTSVPDLLVLLLAISLQFLSIVSHQRSVNQASSALSDQIQLAAAESTNASRRRLAHQRS